MLISKPDDYLRITEFSQVKAIIAISMWGYPVDINEINQYIDKSISVIHDCALSQGSEYDLHPDGSRSKLAFYSFGVGKPICMGFGGRAEFAGMSISEDFDFEQEKLTNVIYKSLKCLAKSYLFKPQVYQLVNKFNSYRNSEEGFTSSIEDITTLPFNPFTIENRKLKVLKTRINHSRSRVTHLKKMFVNLGFTVIDEQPKVSWNYWMFPVLAPQNIDTNDIVKKMGEYGFEIGLPYRRTIQLAKKYWGYKNTCKNTEKDIQRMFTIPSPHRLSDQDIIRFISAFSSNFGGA